MELCWRLNVLINIAHLEQCLAHAKHSINVSCYHYIVSINFLKFQTKSLSVPASPLPTETLRLLKTLNNLNSTYIYHYPVQSSSTPKLQTHQINSVFPIMICTFMLPCLWLCCPFNLKCLLHISDTCTFKARIILWSHTWATQSNQLPFPVSPLHLCLYLALTLVCLTLY